MLWRTSAPAKLATLEGHTDAIDEVCFTPDGQTLISSSWDKTIRLWRVPDGTLGAVLTGHSQGANNLIVTLDGQLLISGSPDGTARLWQLPEGKLQKILDAPEIWRMALSSDGALLVGGGHYKQKLYLW